MVSTTGRAELALLAALACSCGTSGDVRVGDRRADAGADAGGMPACTEAVVTAFAVGDDHVCAAVDDGTVWCWGQNELGQLGDGTLMDTSTPARAFADSLIALTAGNNHTCGLRADRTAVCWGQSTRGQLGVAAPEGRYSVTPVDVAGGAGFSMLRTWESTTCAIRDDAALVCWGAGFAGAADIAVPEVIDAGAWQLVAPGFDHACAIRDDGALFCWGANLRGELGLGGTGPTPAPTRVGTQSFAHVASGDAMTCAVDDGGAGFCWGRNGNGQLGVGDRADRDTPARVDGAVAWQAITVGARHACGLDRSGGLFCWGAMETLGQPAAADALVPTRVPLEGTFVRVESNRLGACALSSVGALYCWGRNDDGELGQGDVDPRVEPVRPCIPR